MFSKLHSWVTSSKKRSQITPPSIPLGQRVYVVGDIHGRIDLLKQLHKQIADDAALYEGHKTIVYLGDYIDRGHESKSVIDELISHPLNHFTRVFLKGNHEDALLNFLNDYRVALDWFQFGGEPTVYSYGVAIPLGIRSDEKLKTIQSNLKANLSEAHLTFYSALQTSHEIGDYYFVHAGVSPNRGLGQQRDEDLMWIRDEFLRSKKNHGKMVVHGHSITENPEEHTNRIGIDTGAYYSHRLTCLVLEGVARKYLHT